MEKNLQFFNNLNSIESQLNLQELPPELLELILVALWNEEPKYMFARSALYSDIYNFSLACRFFYNFTNSSRLLWKKRYFHLMLEVYNHDRSNFPELEIVLDVAKENPKNDPVLLIKSIYYRKLYEADSLILKLMRSIYNDLDKGKDGSLHKIIVSKDLFANFNTEVIANRILALNYDLNYVNQLSCNILHYFVLTGDVKAVTSIIKAGANVNHLDNIGMPPLGRVIQSVDILMSKMRANEAEILLPKSSTLLNKYIEMAQCLIKYNTDVDLLQDNIEQKAEDNQFSSTINELFRMFENMIQINKEVDRLYDLAANVLSCSQFKNNFEEFLEEPNDIILSSSVIEKIKNRVESLSLNSDIIGIAPIESNRKFKMKMFIEHLEKSNSCNLSLSQKYLRDIFATFAPTVISNNTYTDETRSIGHNNDLTKAEIVTEYAIKQSNKFPVKTGLKNQGQFQVCLAKYFGNNFVLGKALDQGDCFFDALAQTINLINSTEVNTAKYLRTLCYEFYIKNKALVHKWLTEDLSTINQKIEDYHLIQYTDEECQQVLNGRAPLWGRPFIEGRILCHQLDLTCIGVIEILVDPETQEPSVGFYLVTQNEYRLISDKEAQRIYQDSNLPVITVEQNSLHFIPLFNKCLLPSEASQNTNINFVKFQSHEAEYNKTHEEKTRKTSDKKRKFYFNSESIFQEIEETDNSEQPVAKKSKYEKDSDSEDHNPVNSYRP